MDRGRTRGHAAAVAAVEALLAGGGSHAVLLVGPEGVGKTTLALDLAAALLCTADGSRPCRACRGCRMVEHGNHPDLHRLRPDGPGGQIRIGARSDPEPGTVRRLISDLALLPVEGGARVAVVEQAHRLNEDAQSALLKTLEEPPAGVTIVLCADDEERLLPTIRSRCARLRLGPVGLRDIEGLLVERGIADAPTAARLGRLAGGRPGTAIAWASAPEAAVARDAIARELLDLIGATRAQRLVAARDLIGRASSLASAIEAAAGQEPPARAGTAVATRPASRAGRQRTAGTTTGPEADAGDGAVEVDAAGSGRRAPVAERRRAVATLIGIWRDLARDLAVAALDGAALVRDTALLDELAGVAARLPPGAAASFLDRLARAGELLEANVGPELVLDGLLLAWPPPAGGRSTGNSGAVHPVRARAGGR